MSKLPFTTSSNTRQSHLLYIIIRVFLSCNSRHMSYVSCWLRVRQRLDMYQPRRLYLRIPAAYHGQMKYNLQGTCISRLICSATLGPCATAAHSKAGHLNETQPLLHSSSFCLLFWCTCRRGQSRLRWSLDLHLGKTRAQGPIVSKK